MSYPPPRPPHGHGMQMPPGPFPPGPPPPPHMFPPPPGIPPGMPPPFGAPPPMPFPPAGGPPPGMAPPAVSAAPVLSAPPTTDSQEKQEQDDPSKHTTVFVGNVSGRVAGYEVPRLLRMTGKVIDWKGAGGFGYCTFATPDEALRGVRLLNGLTVGDKDLKLQVDEKTREALDAHIAAKKSAAEEELDEDGRTKEQIEADAMLREEIHAAVQKISLLPEKKDENGSSGTQSGKQAVDPDTALPDAPTMIAAGREMETQVINKEILAFRESASLAESEERASRSRSSSSRRDDDEFRGMSELEIAETKAKRAKARRFDRFMRRNERDFEKMERDCMERQRQREKDRRRHEEREQRRKKDLLDNIEKQKEFDRTYNDEEDDDRYYRPSMLERLRSQRQREAALDERSRRDEEAALKALQEKMMAQEKEKSIAEESKQDDMKPAASTEEEEEARPGQKRKAEEEPEAQKGLFGIRLEKAAKTSEMSPSVFGEEDEEEEVGKRRKSSKPLEFSEQELRRAGIDPVEFRKKKQKEIVSSIPANKDDLFSYNIDWNQVDDALVAQRVKPWVTKRIVEYLGEPEDTLIAFICDKIRAAAKASEILSNIAMVLDEDAETFVVKLWRFVIFETESRRFGVANV